MERSYGNKSDDRLHCMFSNLVLHGILHKAVRFAYKRESRGFLLTNEMISNKIGVTEKTVAVVLAKKSHKNSPTVI